MTSVNTSWMADLLAFDRHGDTFVAAQAAGSADRDRLFGGQIAAQALGAAGATVDPDKRPQSLHAYFIRAGRFATDVEFQVERTRDGRSFDTRRVTAVQGDAAILEMIASFHRPEPAADWQPSDPPSLEFSDTAPKVTAFKVAERFEIRTAAGDDTGDFAVPPYWVRTRDPIEDDPLIRACTLAFVSDLGPVPAARPPGTRLDVPFGFAASLDHSVWFHRPYLPAQWHRYEVRRVNNGDARGLVVGSLFDEAGSLVASMAQEALWRP